MGKWSAQLFANVWRISCNGRQSCTRVSFCSPWRGEPPRMEGKTIYTRRLCFCRPPKRGEPPRVEDKTIYTRRLSFCSPKRGESVNGRQSFPFVHQSVLNLCEWRAKLHREAFLLSTEVWRISVNGSQSFPFVLQSVANLCEWKSKLSFCPPKCGESL